jgi:hypothetical protein
LSVTGGKLRRQEQHQWSSHSRRDSNQRQKNDPAHNTRAMWFVVLMENRLSRNDDLGIE